MKLYQCKIRDPYGRIETAWIEERGAIKGKFVEVKGDNDNFWEVLEVYDYAMDKKQLDESNSKARKAFHSGDLVRGNK